MPHGRWPPQCPLAYSIMSSSSSSSTLAISCTPDGAVGARSAKGAPPNSGHQSAHVALCCCALVVYYTRSCFGQAASCAGRFLGAHHLGPLLRVLAPLWLGMAHEHCPLFKPANSAKLVGTVGASLGMLASWPATRPLARILLGTIRYSSAARSGPPVCQPRTIYHTHYTCVTSCVRMRCAARARPLPTET